MNIAFPALLIFLLIIPGFLFLAAYEKKENTILERKPLDSSFSIAVTASIIIHWIAATIVIPHLVGESINYPILIKLLTGLSLNNDEIKVVENSLNNSAFYFIAVFLCSYGLGKILQRIMFKCNPYKSSAFAFDIPWYYELKGKHSESNNADLIKLSCMEDNKNSLVLYYGILEDFYLTKDGQLDRIVLSTVLKIQSSDLQNPTFDISNLAPIDGDRLVLKYQNICNINIEYLYIQESPEG